MNNLEINNSIFEDIKHLDEKGNEFWYARELQVILNYKEWRNFKKTINKAIDACKNSGNNSKKHFVDLNRVLIVGHNAKMEVFDYKLSRYACYLIAQNGDSRKK